VPLALRSGTAAASLRGLDPRQVVVLPRDPLPPGGRQAFTPATWTSRTPDTVLIEVSTRAPGLLVVGNTWMPGWEARVNGSREAVLRGNHAQQVVPLRSAGDHRVVLRYRPPGLVPGVAVSGASAVAWVLLGLYLSRREGPNRRIRPIRGASGSTTRGSGAP